MEKINTIIAKELQIAFAVAQENHTMDDINSWDSITHMNLIVAIETECNIMLSGDDIAEMTSFDAIRTIVQKYL